MDTHYSRQEILQGLSDALKNMLHHAQNDSWDEVANYNKVRTHLSGQLRPSTNGLGLAEQNIIEDLSRMDSAILELATKARDSAGNDMQSINGRKSNMNQYIQNQYA